LKLSKLYILSFIVIFLNTLQAQDFKKYELEKINFTGNDAVSNVELQSVIISQETPNWFSKFLNSFSSFGEPPIYFDSSNIPIDINAIKNLYISKGYFQTEVSYSYTFDTSASAVQLTYSIKENDPVKFRKLTLNGLEKLPAEFAGQMNELVAFDSSAIYSAEYVENTKAKVINFLRDHGYMLAESAKPFVEVDTSANYADVRFDFILGKRYKISEVRVSKTGAGKDFVSDNLMKEIVGIEPGTVYSNYDLRRAQVRLYRTNLFSSALVTTIIADTVNYKVPLSISVDVNKMHELSPELITNNEDNTFNLGLGLAFVRKNFFGDARKFSISTSAAAQNILEFLRSASIEDTTFLGYADARIGMEQPFLFGKPINTSIESYFTLQKRKNEYNSSILGTKLSLDFELPQYTYITSLTTYFNWENAKYIYKRSYIQNNLKTAFTRLYNSQAVVDSLVNYYMNNVLLDNKYQTNNILLGIELGAEHTNNILFPSRGYSLSMIFEDGNSIPYLISKLSGGDFTNPQYLKVFLNSSFYLPVFYEKTSAIGVKFRIGNIFTYRGERANISLNQRFYSGGSNSVRGWSSRELVPKDPEIDITAPNEDFNSVLLRGIAPGGFFMLESSIELRERLFGALGYAIFVDVGNTWNSAKNFRYDELAGAFGFGFRFYTEFIPIRVDFGFKGYDPYDKRSLFSRLNDPGGFWNIFQFHLGIGESF